MMTVGKPTVKLPNIHQAQPWILYEDDGNINDESLISTKVSVHQEPLPSKGTFSLTEVTPDVSIRKLLRRPYISSLQKYYLHMQKAGDIFTLSAHLIEPDKRRSFAKKRAQLKLQILKENPNARADFLKATRAGKKMQLIDILYRASCVDSVIDKNIMFCERSNFQSNRERFD